MQNPLLVSLLVLAFGNCYVSADQHPITIDGQFLDWQMVELSHEDPLGDGVGIVDFGKMWLADDDDFLFVRIEFTGEIDATENNNVRLLLDTDLNDSTGQSIAGLGVELEWNLGSRFGLFYFDGGVEPIAMVDIQFRGGPTVTSDVFEFAIGRNSLPDGFNPLFVGSQFNIAFDDLDSADQIPDTGQKILYEFDQGMVPDTDVISLERSLPSDIRLVSHNVLFDNPWNSGLQPSFDRLWSAVQGDIYALQEIYNHSLTETLQLINQLVPPDSGEMWYGASHSDCFTISKFPVLDSWAMAGNLAVLLDTTSVLPTEMLVINAHLPCCDNEGPRQNEIDQIMSFVREAKLPGGSLFLAPDTPIIICGDLNLVGFASQLETLLTGSIANNQNYGPDFDPDWDDTPLTSVVSRQTEKRMGYTWRSDSSSFWPGQLDFIIYSDSVVEVANNYLIYTPEMSDPESLGLMSQDSLVSDHLVFVSDFRLVEDVLHGDVNSDGVVNLLDVAPFIDLLSNGEYQAEADVNKDGSVDLLDVDPFIDLLSG